MGADREKTSRPPGTLGAFIQDGSSEVAPESGGLEVPCGEGENPVQSPRRFPNGLFPVRAPRKGEVGISGTVSLRHPCSFPGICHRREGRFFCHPPAVGAPGRRSLDRGLRRDAPEPLRMPRLAPRRGEESPGQEPVRRRDGPRNPDKQTSRFSKNENGRIIRAGQAGPSASRSPSLSSTLKSALGSASGSGEGVG